MKLKKYFLPVGLVFFIASVALAVFIFWDKNSSQKESGNGSGKPVQNNISLNEKKAGRILGEAGNNVPITKYGSENFHVPQIVIGAEGEIYYPGAEDQKELAVSDVKSEIFTDKNKKDKKVLLAWTTNKSTKSAIEYGKAGTEAGQKFEEVGYSLEHSVLLEPLESSTTYNYVITMRDRGGTTASTDKFAIYTGAPQISFLDMLAGAFKGVFGWAVK